MNRECNNMQAHILSLHTPPTPVVGSKFGKFFLLKEVILHMKLNRIANAATRKHILCPYTHPRPLRWSQRSRHFFSESSHDASYQIERNGAQITMQAHILSLHTLNPWVGLKGENSECGHVAYQIKGKEV